MRFLRGIFDNDSVFGQTMTRCGTLIGANLLFLLFSIPVVTIGASLSALYYTMLKCLRYKQVDGLFSTFWEGFRDNFRQATVAWLGILALAFFLVLEIFWCTQFTGFVAYFRYGLYVLLSMEILIALYLFPVMAAFRGSLPQLMKNSILFVGRRPLDLLQILFVHIMPMVLTYTNIRFLPLFAFLWTAIGFSAIAMFGSSLLLKQFLPYLSSEDYEQTDMRKTEAEILEEMKQLDM